MRNIEKIVLGVFVIGLFFKFNLWAGGSILLILSLSILSVFYSFFSFYFFSKDDLKKQNIFVSIVSGFIFSIIPIAVLFKLFFWPNSEFLFKMGMVTLVLLGGAIEVFKRKSSKDQELYYIKLRIRTLIMLVITILFFIISPIDLLKIEFRNHPELRELRIKCYENPDNEEFQKELDDFLKNK